MPQVSITVNGKLRKANVEPRLLLVHFLREHLLLTGTHVGCDTSQCGACTVLIDGRSAKACTLFAVQADGANVTTIEGLAKDGQLHPIQEGFWEEHGLQCGYCTPGMIMSAVNLLTDIPTPDEQQIREGISGNFCRCTGYQHIVNAIQYAAKKGGAGLRAQRPAEGGLHATGAPHVGQPSGAPHTGTSVGDSRLSGVPVREGGR